MMFYQYIFFMINQVLLHSLSKVIQGTSKNCFRMKLVVVVIASFEFPGCDGLSGVFPTIFVLYSNDYDLNHYHQLL